MRGKHAGPERCGLMLALVVWAAAVSGQTPAPALPPEVPPVWARLVGDYGRGPDTLSLREEDGQLQLLWWHGGRQTLRSRTDSTLRLPGGGEVLVRRGPDGRARELAIGDVSYPRFPWGPDLGGVFRITPRGSVDSLRSASLAATPPAETGEFLPADLVELVTLDSTIRLDIRYAGRNNFLGTPLYSSPRAFLQRPAAEALVRAHRWLRSRGYGLLIHDGYRPWYVTRMFWEATPDSLRIFVADPSKGSRHNRGAAVDLTLYDLATGRAVDMPGTYDEMSPRSFPAYPGGTSRQRWFRELLRRAMEAEGFTVYEAEWWHFDYKDWRRYRIGNRTFEQM